MAGRGEELASLLPQQQAQQVEQPVQPVQQQVQPVHVQVPQVQQHVELQMQMLPEVAGAAGPAKPVSWSLDQIARSPSLLLSLDISQWEEEYLVSRLDREEIEWASVQSELYRLLGIFFLFQGIIFGGVAQSDKLDCADCWFPFSLSLVTSIVATIAVWQKLRIASDLEKEIADDECEADAIYKNMANLVKQGNGFDVDTDKNALKKEPATISYIYAFAVTFFLVLFSIVMLVSVNRIICDK